MNSKLDKLIQNFKIVDSLVDKISSDNWAYEFNTILNEILVIVVDINQQLSSQVLWINFWNEKNNVWFSKDNFKGFTVDWKSFKNNHRKFIWENYDLYKQYIISSRHLFDKTHLSNEAFRLSLRKSSNTIFNSFYIDPKEIILSNNNNLGEYYNETYRKWKNNLSIVRSVKINDQDNNHDNICKFLNWITWVKSSYPEKAWSDSFYLDSKLYYSNSFENYDDKKDIEDSLSNALIFCNVGVNITDDDEDVIIEAFIYRLRNVLNKIRFIREKIEYEKIIRKSQIKSAIAAIMSRNMSHNLGSHVFYYTRQNLLNIYETVKDSGFKYTREIKGLSWFLHYVQERQDFVANINSGDRYIFGPLNLKQDVIDEIAPDALDQRHINDYNKANKITKNFLLENIVKSEKISRHSSENKSLANIQIEIKFNGKTFSTETNDVDNDFYNLDFAVQGGQQSRHAFLIMLENIIRNSAKHAFNESQNHDLTITIDVVEEDGKYNISIYDNTQNAPKALDTLKNSLSNLKFIDKCNYTIDRSNKGLKEILVSVLWLKGLDFGFIEKYAKDSEILKIENKYDNIAYTFSVPVFKRIEKLETQHIANILTDESLNIFASVFTVSTREIEEFIKNDSINRSTEAIFEELNKRIPRLLFVDDSHSTTNNHWETIFKQKFEYKSNKSNLLFDRSRDESNNENVSLVEYKDVSDEVLKKNSVYFNNHLSKNKDNLINSMNKIRPSDGLIYENVSGANQAFNLMQKFKKSLIDNTEDLYWNVLLNYNTKIVIVDERLAFSPSSMYNLEDDLESYNNKIITIDDIFKKSGLKNKKTEFTNNYSSSKNILSKLNERYSLVNGLNDECINYQLPDLPVYNNYIYIPKISQDVYEKFKFQQNTFVFNLNIEDFSLINSLNFKEKPFLNFIEFEKEKYMVDFFSIHIGIIDKIKEKEKEKGNTTKEIINSILDKNKIVPKYVCVHSGRGGLNDKNDKINFIPFSILQRCFEDSKFLLSEFLYNNQYIPL